ncbi:MAG: phage tail tape measure protein [Clostridia bacterium]|nr:phage tail tape measure protein [Clostridia bacterium]
MAKGKNLQAIVEIAGKVSPSLGESLKAAEKGLGKLKAVAVGAAIGGAAVAATKKMIEFSAECVKAAGSYQTAFAAASTLMKGTKEELQGISDDIIKVSNETGIAAEDLAGSVYSAISAGIAQEDAVAFAGKSAKLAAAGFTDVDTALSTVAKTLNAYGMGAEETDRIQKVLIQTQNLGITTVGELGSSLAQVTPTASAFGVSFEQVGASLAVMTGQGTATAQATTQLNAMIAELGKQGTKAQKSLAEAAKGTQYAGMSFSEMMDAGATLNDMLGMIDASASASGMSMVDMFSSLEAGKAALSIYSGEGEKFVNALGEMSTEADVVGEAYDKVSDTFEHQVQVMQNMWQNAKISFGQKLMPLVMKLAEKAMPVLESAIDALGPVFDNIIETVMPVLDEILPQILPILTGELIPTVLDLGAQLVSGLLPPIMQIVQALLPPLVQILQMLMPVIQALLPVITLLAGVFSDVLVSALNQVMPIIEFLMGVLNGLIEFIEGVFTGNWSQAWSGIASAFRNYFGAVITFAENIANGAIDVINGLLSGVRSLASKVGITIPVIPHVSLPRFAAGGFTQGLSLAGEAGQEAIISFDPAFRDQNIGYWLEAGRRLGAGDELSTAGRLLTLDSFSLGNLSGGDTYIIYDFSGMVYSPTINGGGNAEDMMSMLRENEAEFTAWLEEWLLVREEGRF